MIVGAVSLALLFGLERFARKIPAAPTVVVLAVPYIRLVDPSGVAIVGQIPQGREDHVSTRVEVQSRREPDPYRPPGLECGGVGKQEGRDASIKATLTVDPEGVTCD